jgi:hypothetical protein
MRRKTASVKHAQSVELRRVMNKTIGRRAFVSALPAALLACTLPRVDAAVSQQSVSEQPVSAIDNALSNLSLLSESSLTKLSGEVDHRNRSLLASFIAQLSSPTTSDDAKLYAAYYMGEFRFSDASHALAEHVTLKDNNLQRQSGDALWLWGQYPVAGG